MRRSVRRVKYVIRMTAMVKTMDAATCQDELSARSATGSSEDLLTMIKILFLREVSDRESWLLSAPGGPL